MRLIDADALKTDLTRFYDGVVTAKQLIDEQPTVYCWISVKDKLPDKSGNYLVVHKSYAYVGMSHFLTNLRDNGQFEYEGEPNEPGFYNGDGDGDWVERDITYWMPLPDLPKEA